MIDHRKNLVLKKLFRYGAAVPRLARRITASETVYQSQPPILANSFPKSGTHLLVQILAVVPGVRDWGDFWASQPSFSFREVEPSRMAARIRRVAPAEMVSGHLHYSPEAAEALHERRVVHYFIYRDPRDVVVSEAHYLATMNRWHRLHPIFRKLPSQADRLLLSIRGLPSGTIAYPNVAERFARYAPWLSRPDVCALNYEDLVSPRRDEVLARIFTFLAERTGRSLDVPGLVRAAAEAIQPRRSHTFRRGGTGGWQREFDDRVKGAFKSVGSNLLIQLGYEHSAEW